jgi:succinate-semialdehyde dehydrogenase/glutarate-semialdehyde dehydrogenase
MKQKSLKMGIAKMLDQINLGVRLKKKKLLKNKAYINGAWVDAKSGKSFEVVNPSNGQVIVSVPDLDVNDARIAIDAAHKAFPHWSKKTAKERSIILNQFYKLMLENADDLAAILTAEMGKPLAEAKGEIIYGASFIEWFAEEGKRVYGETIPGHQEDKRIIVLKQPVGVVAAITPWNFPNAMITRKLGPALAAGCCFVAKAPEDTPLSALALCDLAEEAGIPKGVFSVLTTSDPVEIGKDLCSNDKIRKLTFTGSTEVGKKLLKQGADQVLKMSMELGGNAPFIVFDDADIDKAVEGAIISKFRNNGQTCVCANRIYVQDGVYEVFAKRLEEAVSKMVVGDGFSSSSTLGPLITKDALKKVEEHIKDALNKGATAQCGGKRHSIGKTFFEPTVLTNVDKSMLIAEEETFGPVAPLFRFKDEDDVIEQANNTIFGLASYFYASDLKRVWKVAEALEYGMVGINTGLISTEVAPFGGVKQSGLGREGSHHGIDEYLELKYLCLSL